MDALRDPDSGYRALIVRASSLRPHPNADKLSLVTACHYQVIVGRDTKADELLVFFEAGGQLSERFADVNKLRRTDGGMFEPNLRVKPIKLRGQRSDGFCIPVASLSSFGDISKLKEGDEFSTFGGVEICRKYESQETKRIQRRTGTATFKVKLRNFPEHSDTGNFRREGHYIPVGSILYVSEKLHGTSGRLGNVLTLSHRLGVGPQWLRRLASKLFGMKSEYARVNGTRRVVLSTPRDNTEWHGGDKFRFRATEDKTLSQNEVAYFELVGYGDNGAPIQHQPTSEYPDIRKLYGERMNYVYGMGEGESRAFVYRMTTVSPQGLVVEYAWPIAKARALAVGFDVVPVVMGPIVYDGDFDKLYATVDKWVNGNGTDALQSVLDPLHIREGAVVRVETSDGRTLFYKHKSWAFLALEGLASERGQVDVEDVEKPAEGEGA